MAFRIAVILVLSFTLVLTYFFFPDNTHRPTAPPQAVAPQAVAPAPNQLSRLVDPNPAREFMGKGVVWEEVDLSAQAEAGAHVPAAVMPPAEKENTTIVGGADAAPSLPVPPPQPGEQRKGWQANFSWIEEQMSSCRQANELTDVCVSLPARVAERVFGLRDFSLPAGAGKSGPVIYSSVQEMAEYVTSHGQTWKEIGEALSQETLSEALAAAKAGKMVAAFRSGAQDGVIAFVLPHDAGRSSTWEMDVPEAFVVFIKNPGASFVRKRLSFAWKRDEAEEVKFFVRVGS